MQDVIETTDNGTQGVQKQKPTVLKPHIPEQWEINIIGSFLLEVLNKGMLTSQKNWEIEKLSLRREYDNHMSATPMLSMCKSKLKEVNGTADIGTLLHRTNFLIDTPRGSRLYRIRDWNLLKFRHEKLLLLDEKLMNGNAVASKDNDNESEKIIDLEQAIKEHNVDEDSERFPLEYQGTETQKRDQDFGLTSFGCYICQLNFEKIDDYENHVEYHGDELDFKSLETLSKLSTSMLKLCYQLCIKSHYFCFTIETTLDNIIIDKIIIVQSGSFYYVNNSEMPYKMTPANKYKFFVDSHLFTIFKEQPIVIVYRLTDDENAEERYVEQHHFMRTEAFPKVHFAINPYRLSQAMLFKPKYKLESYLPDKTLLKKFECIPSNDILFEMSTEFKDYYRQNKCFSLKNMPKAMEIMLRVEDVEIMNSYRKLTQTKVTLRQVGKELTMRLNTTKSENVLSPFDQVIMIAEQKNKNENIDLMDMITKPDEDMRSRKAKIYMGRVERVNNGRITFESDMIVPEKETYTVLFRPDRLLMRRQYRSLELLKYMGDDVVKRFLFPEIDRTMQSLAGMFSLDLNDKSFYENPEQFQAIKQIATSNRLEAPYIIFGPPGTGKTATIVEAIMQLYLQRSNSRILIMAGSNSACDEIALRLLQIITKNVDAETKTLTRIFSQTNDKRVDNIDELLLDYSNMYSAHFYPHVEILHLYRIVVCTLAVGGKLATGKFGKDLDGAPVFTHVFVDEAAASTEAETLMGIVCAMSPRASLILSGDHKQLGPIIKSNRAGDLGLKVSLMERLLQRECYQVDEVNGNYDHSIQSRLIRNYRSHPQIVKLYSKLYYEDKLMALANQDDVNFCQNWYLLPNPNFPIIFHAEFGNAERGNNSVSLYNNREIDTVLLYVSELMHFGVNGKKIKQTDIGIISPYKNQYMRIQEQLNIRNWHNIECGSVETFQGKEKLIIIVSFVRSFSASLGFLENPRRLNVTLSRPKSLLILVGNPHTLSMNSDYKYIIDMCKANNTSIGAKIYNNYNVNKLMDNNTKQQQQQPPPNESNKQRKRREWIQRTKGGNAKKNAEKSVPKKVENAAVLGQAMKKRVNPVSNQKQRQKLETFKNIYESSQSTETKVTTERDEFIELLDQLPRVPKTDVTLSNESVNPHKTVQQQPTKRTVPQKPKAVSVDSTAKVGITDIKSNASSVNTNFGIGAVPKVNNVMTNGTTTGIRPSNVVTLTTSSYNTQNNSTASTLKQDSWTGQGIQLKNSAVSTSVPRSISTTIPRTPTTSTATAPRPVATSPLTRTPISPGSTPLYATGTNTGQSPIGQRTSYVSSPSRSSDPSSRFNPSNFENYSNRCPRVPPPPPRRENKSNCIIA